MTGSSDYRRWRASGSCSSHNWSDDRFTGGSRGSCGWRAWGGGTAIPYGKIGSEFLENVNDTILTQRTAWDILQLHSTRCAEFSVVNLSTALHRLGKSSRSMLLRERLQFQVDFRLLAILVHAADAMPDAVLTGSGVLLDGRITVGTAWKIVAKKF